MARKDSGHLLPENLRPGGEICLIVPVPDDPGYLRAVIGQITKLGMWFAWERDPEHRAAVASRVMQDATSRIKIVDCDQSARPNDKFTNPQSFWGNTTDDCEDDMPQILKLNGRAYLANNCGCGDTELYALTRAAFEPGGVVDEIPPAGFTVDDTAFDCYQSRAYDVFVGRVLEYHDFLTDIANMSIDALLAAYGPAVAVVDFLANWAVQDTTVDILRGYTQAELAAAYASTAVIDALRPAWSYRGDVTRDNLRAWLAHAPDTAPNGVPLSYLHDGWLRFANLSGFNEALSVAYSKCKTGETFQPEFTFDEIEHEGVVYPVWTWVNPGTLDAPDDAWHTGTMSDLIIGGWYWASIPYTTGGGADYVRLGWFVNEQNVSEKQTGYQNATLEDGFYSVAAAEAIIKALDSRATDMTSHGTQATQASVRMQQETTSEYSAVLEKVIVVGDPYAYN